MADLEPTRGAPAVSGPGGVAPQVDARAGPAGRSERRRPAWALALVGIVFAVFAVYFHRSYGYLHWQVLWAHEPLGIPDLDPVRSHRGGELLGYLYRGARYLSFAGLVCAAASLLGRPLWIGVLSVGACLFAAAVVSMVT